MAKQPEIIETETVETGKSRVAMMPGDRQQAATGCCGLPPSLRLAPAEADELAGMFKALGHPVRLQIVDLLSRFEGQVCVCDLESQFELSQPTISHHLKILREAGLVEAEQRGLWVYYYLRPAAVTRLGALLQGVCC